MKKTVVGFLKTLKTHTVMKVILGVEAVITILLIANCLRSRCDYAFTSENLVVADEMVSQVTEEDGRVGYTVSREENIEETTILYTDEIRLYPGAYRIKIDYQAQVNYEDSASIVNGNGYLYLDSLEYEIYLNFESMFLRNGMDSNEQTFQVTSPSYLDGLSLSVSFYGLGELTVYSVEIQEIVAYRYVSLFGALFLFAAFDLICFLLFIDREYQYKKELGILLLISLGANLPFIADYVIAGHDTSFHAYRILLLAHELAEGNFFPAIYTAGLNGYGYAAPLLYGQVFLYVPAVLYNCGFSLTASYNVYLILISTATCLIMYYCTLKIIRRRNAALLGAALYTLSAVRLTNILTRAALGEATAQIFLPLLVLGFYNIYTAPKGEKITIRRYWPVVIGLTAILLSHTLTMLMSVMVILTVCLILIRKTLEPQRFFALLRAALLTLTLNLSTLVPMIDSMGMDLNVNHVVNYIQTSGAYLIQLLNSVVNNYQAYNAQGTASNELSLSIGFSITLGLAFFVVYRVKAKRDRAGDKAKDAFITLCFALCVAAVFLSTVYMFYDYLDFLPDMLYKVLTVYQYPWRWLIFAVLFGSFGTAAIADSERLKSFTKGISVTLLLCTALVINAGQIYADQLRSSDMNRLSNNVNDYYYVIGSSGEYLLYGTDVGGTFSREADFYGDGLTVTDYACEDGTALLWVENASDEEAQIDLPLFHYDHYLAYDLQTGEEISISTGENNRIRLHVPAEYTGWVQVEYHFRKLWLAAIGVSVAAAVILAGYVIWIGRRKQTGEEAVKQ